MFGADHYVPVLKWKRAEQEAIRALPRDLRSSMTPLVEIVADDPDTAGKQTERLASSWGIEAPFFLDPGALSETIADDKRTGAEVLFDEAEAKGLRFVPVTDLREPPEILKAVKRHSQRGVCLRLSVDDVVNDGAKDRIDEHLGALGVQPSQTDLVLDMGSVEGESPGSVLLKARGLYSIAPLSCPWRTITLAGTAFPYSMAGLPRNTVSRLARTEWLVWRALVREVSKAHRRAPAFGDYGIQHPQPIDFVPPMRMSANIRYATEDAWLIVKGENVFGKAGYEQAYDLAETLQAESDLFGPTHCAGCEAVASLARREGGPGNATTWRQIGFVHHLSLVASQVGALHVP